MAKKKVGAVILTASLAIVATVGITLAYLSDVTETATNTFASDKSISLQLREPKWDGYTFADGKTQNGAAAKDKSDKTLGVNIAGQYVPGEAIPKDPQVKNDGDKGENIYTALKVEDFKVSSTGTEVQMKYEDFAKTYLNADGIKINTGWDLLQTQDNGSQIYIYGKSNNASQLEIGKTTAALFQQVVLSPDIEPDSATGLLPQFHVKVTAYGIQTANVKADEAGTMLLKFIGETKN